MVYWIPTERLDDLQKKVAQINKRAAKLTQPPVSLTITDETEDHEIPVPYGAQGRYSYRVTMREVVTYRKVLIEGSTPMINGWKFVGTIQHNRIENTLHRLPEFAASEDVDFEPFARRGKDCDHCHMNRVRNATYLIQHESGEMKMVGSACLGDFTGAANPQAAARMCESLWKFAGYLGELEKYVGRTTKKFTTTEWLAVAAEQIREYGWTSRNASYETGEIATADRAKRAILDGTTAPTEEDFNRGLKLIDWAKYDGPSDMQDSEYKRQLLFALTAEEVGESDMGLTASGFAAMERCEREKAARNATANSQHIGSIKDKVSLPVTVERVGTAVNGAYGWFVPLNFKTLDGNLIVWFASKDQDVNVGDTITLTGTVKKHTTDRYTNANVTQLTRCKIS